MATNERIYITWAINAEGRVNPFIAILNCTSNQIAYATHHNPIKYTPPNTRRKRNKKRAPYVQKSTNSTINNLAIIAALSTSQPIIRSQYTRTVEIMHAHPSRQHTISHCKERIHIKKNAIEKNNNDYYTTPATPLDLLNLLRVPSTHSTHTHPHEHQQTHMNIVIGRKKRLHDPLFSCVL